MMMMMIMVMVVVVLVVEGAGAAVEVVGMIIMDFIQELERWIVCTPSNVNIFVTLATQQLLECHCKSLFATPCISDVRVVRN
jgi:hypothetical protein